MSRTSAVEQLSPDDAAVAPGPPAPGSARVRALLTWFGVDPRGDAPPLDPDRACTEAGCGQPALEGQELCPVHLGLAGAGELSPTPGPRPRALRALVLATFAAAAGTGLALAVGEPGFGWLGAASTAAVLGSLLARRAGRPIAASLLGTAGFFGASILACAALLLGVLALLPALL